MYGNLRPVNCSGALTEHGESLKGVNMLVLGNRYPIGFLETCLMADSWGYVRLIGITFGQMFIGVAWRIRKHGNL